MISPGLARCRSSRAIFSISRGSVFSACTWSPSSRFSLFRRSKSLRPFSISFCVRRIAMKPCGPKMSCTTSARTKTPSTVRPWRSRKAPKPDLRSAFFNGYSTLQHPWRPLGSQTRGSRCAVRLDIHPQQRLRAGKAQQHPRSIIEDKFCAVRAVNGNYFSSQKCRSIHRDFLHRVCFLFVAEMQVFAHRPEFAPYFLEQLLDLFFDRSPASRQHFRHQQASEDAIFFRNVSANREACALLAAQRDLILANQLPYIFKSHRRLKSGLPVNSCRGIDHLRRSHAARRGHFPLPCFHQIVVNERQDLIRRNPCAIAIDNSEAIGVAIGGQAGGRIRVRDGFAQRREIFFGDVRAGAVEKAIAVGAQRLYGNAVVRKRAMEGGG